MKNQLWTDEETKVLVRMKAAGNSYDEIARGLGRKNLSVQERWYWINMSEAKRAARRTRMNVQRREKRSAESTDIKWAVVKQVVPDYLFIDRERRLAAQRTITGFLCGDPPPGFSALDRKMGGSHALSHGQ